ncbi:MAG TPA: sugar phosphate nucleotidyltransferase [Candidatus Acidoferrales bacterium]|nr:sugar phosphate nucleotidyltransferase [Candidatus Acidoferrales bacterium]
MNKAVVLARGLGTRMRREDPAARLDAEQEAVAASGLKAMISVGRPFLDYVLSGLADAGYGEACLVIGPEHESVVERYSRVAPPRRIQAHFAVQAKPLGTADAVLAAEPFAVGEDFLCINSDNLYPTAVLMEMRAVGEPAIALFSWQTLLEKGNISEEKIRKYAICEVAADGYLRDIVEKPSESVWTAASGSLLISMNCWRFSSAIFEACRRAHVSPRREYELPVAVGDAVRNSGMRLRVVRCGEGVLDLSSRSDVAEVAARLKGVPAEP